jgi:hypothetical protein
MWRQNPKFHHRIHNSPPAISVLIQVNPLHTPPPPTNLAKVHFDPILPSAPWASKWSFHSGFPIETLHSFLPSPTRATCPAHRFGLKIHINVFKLWSCSSSKCCLIIAPLPQTKLSTSPLWRPHLWTFVRSCQVATDMAVKWQRFINTELT